MPIVAHFVERTGKPLRNNNVNDIASVILAIDDAVDTTGALIQARAVTVANANGEDLPEGYFDTNRSIVATFNAAADVAIISGVKIVEVIA